MRREGGQSHDLDEFDREMSASNENLIETAEPGMGAGRHGDSTDPAVARKNQVLLSIALGSFLLFAIAEMIAAVAGNSLSLMGDAATMLVDSATYGLNLCSERGKTGASKLKIAWLELVSPAFSVTALIATTVYITMEAIDELSPDDCNMTTTATASSSATTGIFNAAQASVTTTMLTTTYAASTGCDDESANIAIMWAFSTINLVIDIVNIVLFGCERRKRMRQGGGDSEDNLNMMSALMHIVIDTLRSLSVMVAALMSSAFDVDPDTSDAYAAIVCSLLTLFSTVPLIRKLAGKAQLIMELRRGPLSKDHVILVEGVRKEDAEA